MITYSQLGKVGRLGNQMFQIAGTIGIAIKNGYDYGFPYWKNYDHAFPPAGAVYDPSTEDIDVQAYFKKPLPILPPQWTPERDIQLPWGFKGVHVPDNTNLRDCHMQSEKFFLHCSDVIREYFAIDQSKIEPHVTASFPNRFFLDGEDPFSDDEVCGIHLRFGDYVHKNGYHPVQQKEYYEQAMKFMPDNVSYAVFSDEPKRAMEMLGKKPNMIFFLGNHYMTDLYLMTKCDHFIMCNSTFSWWGAWLIENKDKRVVAPRQWFGPEANGMPVDDIFADGWHVI